MSIADIRSVVLHRVLSQDALTHLLVHLFVVSVELALEPLEPVGHILHI